MSKKVPLNLSIDEKLKRTLKHTAIDKGVSASELIEDYIRAIKVNKDIIKAIQDITKK